jgi:hypothetical protein
MRQAGTIVIAFVIDEDLGFVFETAKGCGMDNAIAIALKAGAHPMRRLRHNPPPARARTHRVCGERAVLNLLDILPRPQHPRLPRHVSECSMRPDSREARLNVVSAGDALSFHIMSDRGLLGSEDDVDRRVHDDAILKPELSIVR